MNFRFLPLRLRKLAAPVVNQVLAVPHNARVWNKFMRSYRRYSDLAPADAKPDLAHLFPCLTDDTDETPVEASYFYQDAWAFEKIARQRPAEHIDVGSNYKFVSLLAQIIPVVMVDLRPLGLPLNGLDFRQGSILQMPFGDGTQTSVSSLCVVEHIGLGRYGDPLDPEGSLKAMAELKRIVQPGGNLYLSVPLDDVNRIYFNAHRAFSEQYLLEKIFPPFEVLDRQYIYNRKSTSQLQPGFGTGCYHLRAPMA